MFSSTQVLVISDDSQLLAYVHASQSLGEQQITTACTGNDAMEKIKSGLRSHLAFIDISNASHSDGLQSLLQLKLEQSQARIVAVCASGNARLAVEAIRLGAHECLVKPFPQAEFETVVSRCLARMPALSLKKKGEIEDVGEGRFLVTSSPAMSKIRHYCSFVAKVDQPVLVLGESGTGKEVVARLIHKISSRANRPFLKVNCAAMPGDLLESELFGYEPGAFTGATHAKPGKFEQANRGTILLDEIGEMPPNLQAKLLHVLQDHQFSRLGGRTTIKVDVRILAATNIDVQEAIATHKLREDLYYRLNAFVVRVPPLRERPDEIALLLEYFTAQQARQWNIDPIATSPAVMEACKQYPWPGNVRELENFAKRLLVLRDEQAVLAELAVPTAKQAATSGYPTKISRFPRPTVEAFGNDGISDLKSVARSAMSEAEAVAIARALNRTRWNRKRAAEMLDISYKALLYKIKQYDLDRPLPIDATAELAGD